MRHFTRKKCLQDETPCEEEGQDAKTLGNFYLGYEVH